MAGAFQQFLDSLDQNTLDNWWTTTNESNVPKDKLGWKYKFEKDGKSFPVLYVFQDLSKLIGEELKGDTLKSNDSNIYRFAEKFNIHVKEHLVYDSQEGLRLKKYFDQVQNKQILNEWIQHCYDTIKQLQIDPYHIRMGISKGDLMVELGARKVWAFKETNKDQVRVRFLLSKDDAKDLQSDEDKVWQFGSGDNMTLTSFRIKSWQDLPAALLTQNLEATKVEYEDAKTKKLSDIRRGASTTNAALKYVLYNNQKTEDFITMKDDTRYFIGGHFWDDEDQYQRFLSEGVWENGYEDKFKKIFDRIRPGDLFALKSSYSHKGDSILRIKAVGNVGSIMNGKMGVTVNWKQLPQYKNIKGLGKYRKTLTEITDPDEIESIFKDKPNSGNSNTKAISPTNIILYGPPGTGKTYSTKSYAVSLAESGDLSFQEELSSDELRRDCLARFNDLKSDGRIEFVTFHQSFAYEDFVQGIRPNVKATELSFEKKDGIFKAICTNALFEYYKLYTQTELKTKTKTFEELWEDFTTEITKQSEALFKMETISKNVVYISSLSDYGNLIVHHEGSSRTHTVSQERMKKIYDVYSSVDQIKSVVEDIRNVIGGSNASAYWAVFKALKEFENDNDSIEESEMEDLSSLSYEAKAKRVQNLKELAPFTKYSVPQFVLIIDEINRANISRVLGELITLLEPDKRLGAKDELIVTLPSGEQFAVPPNLHIIGTMNTADNSIAHLDVALRRRFKFQPLYPNSSLIKDPTKKGVLEALNKRIVEEGNPDLTIGHSYFMGDDDIETIMNEKVLPLLHEYFSQRTEQVEEILRAAKLKYVQDPFGLLNCTGYLSE